MKPRSNSRLKTLQPALQTRIAAYAAAHGQAATRRWLAQMGIPVSRTTFHRWLRWYRIQRARQLDPAWYLPAHLRAGAPRKPWARLKTLSPAQQEAIYAYARTHSLRDTAVMLAAQGIRVSIMTVSRWYRWYGRHRGAVARGHYRLDQRNYPGRMKPHPQSRLKTLPEAVQAEIWDYAQSHSLEDTARWLKERGIKTSRSAISLFLSWYGLRRQLERNESVVQTILEHLRQQGSWSQEQLAQAGQAFFTALALEQQDVRAWAATQRIALQREQLALDRERLEWLRRRAEQAERAEEVARSQLTEAEKLRRMKEIFGL